MTRSRKWGTYHNASNSFDGMVGAVIAGEADVVGTNLQYTALRQRGLDYLAPLGLDYYFVFIAKKPQYSRYGRPYLPEFRFFFNI